MRMIIAKIKRYTSKRDSENFMHLHISNEIKISLIWIKSCQRFNSNLIIALKGMLPASGVGTSLYTCTKYV